MADTKPIVDLPDWSYDEAGGNRTSVNPALGASDITDPGVPRKTLGWEQGNIPPRNFFNWMWFSAGAFIRWLTNTIADGFLLEHYAKDGATTDGYHKTINQKNDVASPNKKLLSDTHSTLIGDTLSRVYIENHKRWIVQGASYENGVGWTRDVANDAMAIRIENGAIYQLYYNGALPQPWSDAEWTLKTTTDPIRVRDAANDADIVASGNEIPLVFTGNKSGLTPGLDWDEPTAGPLNSLNYVIVAAVAGAPGQVELSVDGVASKFPAGLRVLIQGSGGADDQGYVVQAATDGSDLGSGAADHTVVDLVAPLPAATGAGTLQSWYFKANRKVKIRVSASVMVNCDTNFNIGEYWELRLLNSAGDTITLDQWVAQLTLGGATDIHMNGSTSVELVAGEIVQPIIIQNSGNAQNLTLNTASDSYIDINEIAGG